jgi:hypothetical protein
MITNRPDILYQNQPGSLKPKKAKQIKIDPLKYLELKRSEILFKLTNEMDCSEEEADSEYHSLTETVNCLKPLRASRILTKNYLKKILKPISFFVKSFRVNILVKATTDDDTYCYAFNFLADIANQDLAFPITFKNIPEHELLRMLEREQDQHNAVKPVAPPESEKINSHKKPSAMLSAIKPDRFPKPVRLFPDYLLHERRDELAEKLKTEFTTEKGKGIRLMIEALLADKPPLITIENRERKNIYTALKTFFDRNIGTYQSIFDYKFDMISDWKDFESIKAKLDFLLTSLNSLK